VDAPSASRGKAAPCFTNRTALAFLEERYGPDWRQVEPVAPCALNTGSGMVVNSLV
jgi:hypothetical protein